LRDARVVLLKVKDVLWPAKSFQENDAVTKDWDLWGPLVFCLVLSLLMSFGATEGQSQVVFTGIFSMVWLGEAICTVNLKLLGGTVYVPTHTSMCCRFYLEWDVLIFCVGVSFRVFACWDIVYFR